uniref:Uncharacterized protein n=1 Tax=Panagrolaimus davidi TaxID=227884 RepID=A0A914QC14_9BILA
MNKPSKNKVLNLGLLYSHSGVYNFGQQRYKDLVQYLNYTSFDDLDRSAMRSWIWQTCNEFGFFGTTDSGNSFFGSRISLNFYIDICMDVFGYNVEKIKAGIAKTLKVYGGMENYTGTNVIAPRGSIDPWSALALKASNDSSVIPYLIEEGSHCSDMSPPSESDSESMKNLKALILQNIKKWIGVSPINNFVDARSSNNKQKKLYGSQITWGKDSGFYKYKPSKKQLRRSFGRYLHKEILMKKFTENAAYMNITQNAISQPADHFNKTDAKEWNQRFWNNSVFYKSDGPVFLMIDGEGPGGPSFINDENSPFLTWAKRFGADTYFLEHRGYGESLPTSEQSMETLKYISSEQALADIANFIEAINEIRPNSKWITFGGSYKYN